MYLHVVFLFSHWKYKLLWTGIKSSVGVFMLPGTQEFQYHSLTEQMNTSLSENACPNLSPLFIADLLHCAASAHNSSLLLFSPKFPTHPKGLMDPGCWELHIPAVTFARGSCCASQQLRTSPANCRSLRAIQLCSVVESFYFQATHLHSIYTNWTLRPWALWN